METNMHIKIEPTPELYNGPINGVEIPLRIWKGRTEGGVEIEAYVLAITPNNAQDWERLRVELPEFMVRARQAFAIGDHKREKPS
jgi:hypothetical protein